MLNAIFIIKLCKSESIILQWIQESILHLKFIPKVNALRFVFNCVVYSVLNSHLIRLLHSTTITKLELDYTNFATSSLVGIFELRIAWVIAAIWLAEKTVPIRKILVKKHLLSHSNINFICSKIQIIILQQSIRNQTLLSILRRGFYSYRLMTTLLWKPMNKKKGKITRHQRGIYKWD